MLDSSAFLRISLCDQMPVQPHCENRECLNRASVDLEAIAERYGAELSVVEFVNRSVCSECGTRWPNISISLEPGGARGAKMGYRTGVDPVGEDQ